MGQPKRRTTKVGMGATRGTTSEIRSATDPPLPLRDTLLAPAMVVVPEESKTGQRRRLTLPIGAAAEATAAAAQPPEAERHDTIREVAAARVETPTPAPAPPRSGGKRGSRPEREPLRVDQVDKLRSKRISVRGVVEPQPRIVDAKRISRAPLDARDGFVLQLIDGKTTMSELVDASGIAADDLERLVARLVRLGIVAF
jgi:hypothetical protein